MVTRELSTSSGLASLRECARGKEIVMGINGQVPIREKGLWKAKWAIYAFKDPGNRIAKLARRGALIDDLIEKNRSKFLGVKEVEGNLLLNAGINQIWCLVCGTGGTQWTNALAYMAVGISTVAENATQAALGGTGTAGSATATMDATYPTYGTSQLATWRATFGTAVANFAWNEIAVLNGAAGTLMNRKVSAMGTKASGTTWVATLQITLS
jgi:hypothetical protein